MQLKVDLDTEHVYTLLRLAHLELLSIVQEPLLLGCAALVLGISVPHQNTTALCAGSCTETWPLFL